MKVALVHDYLNEFGGAERVLKTLSEIYPKAPIYTSFYVEGSKAHEAFKDKTIKESFLAPILKFGKLYSPLRFLIPVIWGSFDLSEYDLVITSASWYITRGFKVGKNTKVICYCHTPPRWLYGYETSIEYKKYLPVRIYAYLVGHFLRLYDYKVSSKIDLWIANSENIKKRIGKFYRKDSKVIYPPVEVEKIVKDTKNIKKEDYLLIVSRLVGAKGIEEAVQACQKNNVKLKIVGKAAGYSTLEEKIKEKDLRNIKLLGWVDDSKLYSLYAKAKGFLALAKQEDFGITPVEAMAAGTPVIAYDGGGFRESVLNNKTGLLINSIDENSLNKAIVSLNDKKWDKHKLIAQARRFSKERFIKEVKSFVKRYA